MRISRLVPAVLLSLSLVACKGKITQDQCQQLIDHAIDLAVSQQGGNLPADALKQAKEAAKGQMKDALDKCVKEGTASEFKCGMAAKSMDEFMKCDD